MEEWAKRAMDAVKLCGAALAAVLAVLVITIVAKRAFNEWHGRVLEVQPIAVQDAAHSGLEGQVLAGRVAIEINRILAAGNQLGNRTAAATLEDLPEVSIPETGLSLRVIDQMVHAALRDPTRTVTGELVVTDKRLVLTLRRDLGTHVVVGQGEGANDPGGVDRAMVAAVHGLQRAAEPLTYAAYLYETAALEEPEGSNACRASPTQDKGARTAALALLRDAEADRAGIATPLRQKAKAAFLQGLWFHECHDHQTALNHYDRAIAIAPQDAAVVHYHRGNAHQEIADASGPEAAQVAYRLAEADFRRAIALAPRNAFAWNGLGNALAALDPGEEEPVEAYRMSMRLNPAYAAPHVGLGRLYLRRGDMRSATAEFERASLLAAQDAGLIAAMAADLRQHNQAASALHLLSLADRGNGGRPEFQDIASQLDQWALGGEPLPAGAGRAAASPVVPTGVEAPAEDMVAGR